MVVSISGNQAVFDYDGDRHEAEGFSIDIDRSDYLPEYFKFSGI